MEINNLCLPYLTELSWGSNERMWRYFSNCKTWYRYEGRVLIIFVWKLLIVMTGGYIVIVERKMEGREGGRKMCEPSIYWIISRTQHCQSLGETKLSQMWSVSSRSSQKSALEVYHPGNLAKCQWPPQTLCIRISYLWEWQSWDLNPDLCDSRTRDPVLCLLARDRG